MARLVKTMANLSSKYSKRHGPMSRLLLSQHRREKATAPVASRQYFSNMLESNLLEEKQPTSDSISCLSQRLMLYNGMIDHAYTGAYHILPMGLRALNKLKRAINESMRSIGAQELDLSTISSGELWKKSQRWESTGSELFKVKDRHDIDYCLGPTYEEVITSLLASRTISHKKLPILLYQITKKFRDEMAPKYGLLRGREFEMKDLYTFDADQDGARKTYEAVCLAYEELFNRLEINYVKVEGDTGNIGGILSHEYHIPADIGQDNLVMCTECDFSSNDELLNDQSTSQCPKCRAPLKYSKGIEIAHSFLLGRKYSDIFNASYWNEKQKPMLMEMGCYGIGVTRLMAAALEVQSTETKMKWPRLIAPYQICIVPQKDGHKSDVTFALSENLYDSITNLPQLNDEVVIDDRTKFSIGKRLYHAERLGYPFVVTIGRPALESIPKYELIDVYNGKNMLLEKNDLLTQVSELQIIPV